MKDFVGRELKDGDVVWVANSPKFAELGVIVDNSLRTPSHIRIRKSSGCIYLLENPTSEELKKKQEILDEYNKYLEEKKEKRRERNRQRNRQKKEYGKLIGGVYSTLSGQQFIYFGNLIMHIFDEDGNEIKKDAGHVYLELQYRERIQSGNEIGKLDIDTLFDAKKRRVSELCVNKGYKVVDGFLGVHPDLKFPDYRNILGKHPIRINVFYDPTIRKTCVVSGTVQFEENK